ncbi:MAG: HAD-IIIA family hydrolase [Desmonostoc geniculatum HA4340-LM1]|nr:HAD-IIIA family hydrolase [Desmonostoc geniculatum HA4340-LM1]
MKILFVDIDGTLTETVSGHTFKQHSQDVKVMEGADKAVAHFHRQGWTVIGISNQGGCSAIDPETGKPRKSIEDAIAEMQFTMKLLPEIISIYFCPDFEGCECWRVLQLSASEIGKEKPQFIGTYRKPSPGMILHNLESIEVEECWMVGDRPEDEQCAVNAGAGINFCPANVWRDRFRSGMFEHQVTPDSGLLPNLEK